MIDVAELRRLLSAATPGPWGEFAESGDWWVEHSDADGNPTGGFVCKSDTAGNDATWEKQEDIDLMIAAVNALPALLAVAEAAREWETAQREYVGMFESSADAAQVAAAEHRLNRAEDALRAALETQS